MQLGSLCSQTSYQQSTRVVYSRVTVAHSDQAAQTAPANQDSVRLGNGCSKLTYAPVQKVAASDNSQKTQAAQNILAFIATRLGLDAADGAASGALESRLQAAYDGFLKGFGDAQSQLQALGQLSPDVSAAINKTYADVLTGIDDLAKQYGIKSPVPEDALSQVADQQSQSDTANNAAKGVASYQSVQAGERRSFQFFVTTRDGDRVSIQVSAARGASVASSFASASDGQNAALLQQLDASTYSSGKFQFQVNGNLDAGELKAIGDLLNKVNDVANDFFAGDLQQSFQHAQELGFDQNEIARFSLKLHADSFVSAKSDVATQFNNAADGPSSRSDLHDPKLKLMAGFVKMIDELRVQARSVGIDDFARLPQKMPWLQHKDHGFSSLFKGLVDSLDEAHSKADPSH